MSIVVATTIALFGIAAAAPGGGGDFEVDVEFRRTFNLFVQSPVRVRGVDVGVVAALDTRPGSDVVTVTVKLDGDTDMPADAGAVIITSSLLGERYVQLMGGTPGAERLGPGDTIPLERTIVPFEFDEVLEGLNDFVGGLEEDEVARLITNLANLLEGNGEQLGSTIDAASELIDALKENDEELLQLASSVADLNESLSRRDQELIRLLDDFVRVSNTLTAESTDLDGALDGLLVLTRELAELLIDHRTELSDDIDTLTRVGRTASRNLDQFSVAILGSAELFRHAERVIRRDINMLPLVNHSDELGTAITDSLASRLRGACLAGGGTEEECDPGAIMAAMSGGELCFEPFVPCAAASSMTVADAIVAAVRAQPAIGDGLVELRGQRQQSGGGTAEDDVVIDEALERLGLSATSTGSDR